VALCLQGMLGLICDPIGGLVEIPCIYRNASAAMQAIAAAEMALAGLDFPVSADEVIDVMGEVGRRMPAAYRETAMGGLAATPSARRLVQIRPTSAALGRQRLNPGQAGGETLRRRPAVPGPRTRSASADVRDPDLHAGRSASWRGG
jgi:hypothetical protein